MQRDIHLLCVCVPVRHLYHHRLDLIRSVMYVSVGNQEK